MQPHDVVVLILTPQTEEAMDDAAWAARWRGHGGRALARCASCTICPLRGRGENGDVDRHAAAPNALAMLAILETHENLKASGEDNLSLVVETFHKII